VFVVLVVLASTIEFPLADKADPSDHSFVPVPEWYFLFHYQLLKYAPGALVPLASWLLPTVFIGLLFLLPFIDRNPERKLTDRRLSLLGGIVFLVSVFVLLGFSL